MSPVELLTLLDEFWELFGPISEKPLNEAKFKNLNCSRYYSGFKVFREKDVNGICNRFKVLDPLSLNELYESEKRTAI